MGRGGGWHCTLLFSPTLILLHILIIWCHKLIGYYSACFYCRFFESEPDLKSLFPKIVKMNNENQLEYDIDKEMLQRHAVTVLEGLGAAVESLEESDFLNSVLISIGQTHVQRHVKPNMLRVGHLNLQFFNISKIVQSLSYYVSSIRHRNLSNQNACYMLRSRTVIFFLW